MSNRLSGMWVETVIPKVGRQNVVNTELGGQAVEIRLRYPIVIEYR